MRTRTNNSNTLGQEHFELYSEVPLLGETLGLLHRLRTNFSGYTRYDVTAKGLLKVGGIAYNTVEPPVTTEKFNDGRVIVTARAGEEQEILLTDLEEIKNFRFLNFLGTGRVPTDPTDSSTYGSSTIFSSITFTFYRSHLFGQNRHLLVD